MTDNNELPQQFSVLRNALKDLEEGKYAASDIVLVLVNREEQTLTTNVLYSPMPLQIVKEILAFAAHLIRPQSAHSHLHPLLQNAFSPERRN
jgi:hypothetical protein